MKIPNMSRAAHRYPYDKTICFICLLRPYILSFLLVLKIEYEHMMKWVCPFKILQHLYCLQMDVYFYSPVKADINGRVVEDTSLPRSPFLRDVRLKNREGFIYEARHVRECLIKGNACLEKLVFDEYLNLKELTYKMNYNSIENALKLLLKYITR